jgi:FKBP-type peptidyl-prolyl cis-trans isomerase FkpA
MNKLSLIRLFQFGVIAAFGMSCGEGSQEGEELTTETGITYEFVNKGSGELPPDGGFWTLNVDYYNEAGEKIFSSAEQGGPMTLNYIGNYPKNASIEECLSLVGEGDSAIFNISADSLYRNSPGRRTPPDMVGSMIRVHISVDEVYSSEEYLAMMKEKEQARFDMEDEAIQAYIAENNMQPEKTKEGLYYQISEAGEGEKAQPGQNVLVNYTGYLLDGTIFDTSDEEIAKEAGLYNPGRTYGPISFRLAANEVIVGWDIGIGQLAQGGKAKLIIPSPLAYGNSRRGGLIAENSILAFDVELVEIGE